MTHVNGLQCGAQEIEMIVMGIWWGSGDGKMPRT